jgi:NAD(P)-dependent dehydrogenase (short-subunit alcohol dehydrogenase family)
MMATALEHRGATVYMVGRRLDVLESAAQEHAVSEHPCPSRTHPLSAPQKHGNLLPVQGDVTNATDLARVVAHISARHEGVDLLVNNAGIARAVLPRPALRPADDIHALQAILAGDGPADFAEVFAANVTAPYFVALAFLPLLAAGGGGQIVTISSVHGRRRDRAISSVPYSLSKAAGEHLGQILAAVLADWKIRSNVIVAGLFPSGERSRLRVSTVLTGLHRNDCALCRSFRRRRAYTGGALGQCGRPRWPHRLPREQSRVVCERRVLRARRRMAGLECWHVENVMEI